MPLSHTADWERDLRKALSSTSLLTGRQKKPNLAQTQAYFNRCWIPLLCQSKQKQAALQEQQRQRNKVYIILTVCLSKEHLWRGEKNTRSQAGLYTNAIFGFPLSLCARAALGASGHTQSHRLGLCRPERSLRM